MTLDPREIAREVRAVYADWEARPIERACTGLSDCCRFKQTGRTPFLTRGEALVAAQAWRAAGRTEVPAAADGACPFLRNNRCQIYDGRPFGCRTHFCEAAGGPASRKEVRDLIQRLEAIDARMGGNGGVNLPTAGLHRDGVIERKIPGQSEEAQMIPEFLREDSTGLPS